MPAAISHDYPDDLTFRNVLEPDQEKISIWTLHPGSVDIHRAGQLVVLKLVSFAEGTSWYDGSECCKFSVDFHSR